MNTPYNHQLYPFNVDVQNNEEVSKNSSLAYHYDYFSSATTRGEAETLPDASPVSSYSNTGSGLPTGTSPRSNSFLSPSRNMRQPSFPPLFNPDYDQDLLSDGLFPRSNAFSEQQNQQPPPLTAAGQPVVYICNTTDSTNQFSNPHENDRITPTFAPSPLFGMQGPSYGAPTSCFSPYDNTQEPNRRSNGYSEVPITPVENWPLNSSPSDRIHSPVGITASTMSTDSAGQRSHFSNRDEAPPASPTVPLRCYACNTPRIFKNINFLGLHFWDAHAPTAGSPEAWRPCKCIWHACKLEKEFPTHKSWLEHTYAVHYRRFKCTWDGCNWSRPFGSPNSLNRHIRTRHEPPENCKIPGCQGSRANIVRKDKKDEHNANFHGLIVCKVVDCPRGCVDGQDHGFSDPKELSKHMKNKHKHLRSQRLAT